jgi:hypothetical protein
VNHFTRTPREIVQNPRTIIFAGRQRKSFVSSADGERFPTNWSIESCSLSEESSYDFIDSMLKQMLGHSPATSFAVRT